MKSNKTLNSGDMLYNKSKYQTIFVIGTNTPELDMVGKNYSFGMYTELLGSKNVGFLAYQTIMNSNYPGSFIPINETITSKLLEEGSRIIPLEKNTKVNVLKLLNLIRRDLKNTTSSNVPLARKLNPLINMWFLKEMDCDEVVKDLGTLENLL